MKEVNRAAVRMKAEGIPLLRRTHHAWISPAFLLFSWISDKGDDRTTVGMKAEGIPLLEETHRTFERVTNDLDINISRVHFVILSCPDSIT